MDKSNQGQVEAGVPTLQDAFAAFQKRKQQGVRSGDSIRRQDRTGARQRPHLSAERRAQLRTLFVETARSFIGVPYARKHHDPQHCACEGCAGSGRQLFHEPLFLDCCGLVRRVVQRLQSQLGFRLGPWNQAYQFDTLPLRLGDASQLLPGDLVFYSGTYLQPGSRRHAFDITHVEVFVGGASGEATIGSRERHKWVMEYDSYKFQPQRWKLLSYHFCSIDTWLYGVCVPQHPEMWRPRRRSNPSGHSRGDGQGPGAGSAASAMAWEARKYSIFRTLSAGAEADERVQSDGED